MSQNKLMHIPLNLIRENPVALREVNRTTEQYLGLVESIRRNGILNPIVVREVRDPDTGETVYGLIDGLHRFTASQDANMETIPAQVTNLADAEVLEAQILANVHKVETKPVEYSRQLVRILSGNPLMPIAELAARLSRGTGWLSERLGLVKLDPAIAPLVDEGKINLSNAYVLAKLPVEEQPAFLERAMTMNPQEFVPTVNLRIKEVRDAKRQGRSAAGPAEFTAVPHLRKTSELKEEMDGRQVGAVLVRELKVTDPAEGFNLGIRWALHMDPTSIELARQKDQQRQAREEEEKQKRKKEREEKKTKEAQEKVDSVQQQLETATK